MSKKTTIPVEFFSDIICPWCLIGKRKLEKAAAMHGGITLSIQSVSYTHLTLPTKRIV